MSFGGLGPWCTSLEKGSVLRKGGACGAWAPGTPAAYGGTLFNWRLGMRARHGWAWLEQGAEGSGRRTAAPTSVWRVGQVWFCWRLGLPDSLGWACGRWALRCSARRGRRAAVPSRRWSTRRCWEDDRAAGGRERGRWGLPLFSCPA